MYPVWVVLSIIAMVMAFAFIVRKSVVRPRRLGVDVERAREVSVDRYRPMQRLLDESDGQFLAVRGADPKLVRHLRAERRRIFRGYLRQMSRDFERVSGALQAILLTAAQDRPELSETLVRMRVTFQFAMASAHFRVTMQALGLSTVDVSSLIRSLDGVCQSLTQMTAAPLEIGASA